MKHHDRDILTSVAILVSVLLVMMPGNEYGCAEDIILEWDPSPSSKAVGYKVHSRTVSGEYGAVEDVGNVTRHVVQGLSNDEKYIISVTAYDVSGRDSNHSNLVYWGAGFSENGSSNSGGCLIAAVAYGTANARDVLILRQFRHRYLEPYSLGRWVINMYEWACPPLVDLAGKSEAFRGLIRGIVRPTAYALTHPWGSAAAGLTIVAGGAIGFLWHRRRKKALTAAGRSPGEAA
jgi:hypothetical protein